MLRIETIGVMGLVLGVGSGQACVQTRAADHCANLDGDADCARRYPDGERPYCVLGTCEMENLDGCYATRPADDACYSPCGGDMSLADDPACTGVADTGTSDPSGDPSVGEDATDDDASTTAGPETMTSATMTSVSDTAVDSTGDEGPSGCVSSFQCTDASAPICDDGTCVPCTSVGDGDGACAEKDGATPACDGDGSCVQCTDGNAVACDGTTPVCDGGSQTCVGCTDHAQCPDSACRVADGSCFSEACVVEVDGDAGDSLADALADGCVIRLRVAAGGYAENVVLNAGQAVAILGVAQGSAVPLVAGVAGNAMPTVEIGGDAELYVQGVEIGGNTGVGVQSSGAGLWLDRARVVQNAGGGIVLEDGAYARVRNCFVGGDANDVAAIDVSGSTLDLSYTTAAAGFADAAALRCDGPATVDVRNALLVARTDAPEVDCNAESFTNSITEADVGDVNLGWFAGFMSGDLHLTALAPAAISSAAVWNDGDPSTDIDGDPRPVADGSPDAAGADVP